MFRHGPVPCRARRHRWPMQMLRVACCTDDTRRESEGQAKKQKIQTGPKSRQLKKYGQEVIFSRWNLSQMNETRQIICRPKKNGSFRSKWKGHVKDRHKETTKSETSVSLLADFLDAQRGQPANQLIYGAPIWP